MNNNALKIAWICYNILTIILLTVLDLDYKYFILVQFFPLLFIPYFYSFEMGLVLWTSLSLLVNQLFSHELFSLTMMISPLLLFLGRIKDNVTIVEKSIFNKVYIYYAIVIILTLPTATNKFESLKWIITIIPYLAFYFYFRSLKDYRVANVLNICVLLFYFLIIFWGFLFQIQFSLDRLNGPLGNANITGGLMVLIIYHNIYLILEKHRYMLIYFVLIFLAILQLYLTQSRGAELGFVVSLFFLYFMFSNRYKYRLRFCLFLFIGLMGILVVTLMPHILGRFNLLNVKNFSLSEVDRLGVWISAVRLFLSNPLTGVGLNNFGEVYYTYHPFKDLMFLPTDHNMAHNVYLNMIAEHGIFGLVFILGVTIYLIRKGFEASKLSHTKSQVNLTFILISFGVYYLVHNCFDMVWTTIGRHTMFFFIFAVMGITDNYYNKLRTKNE